LHARANGVGEIAAREHEIERDDRRGALAVGDDERLRDERLARALGETAARSPAADLQPERRRDVDARDSGGEAQ